MQFGTQPTLLSRAPIRLTGSFCYSPDDGGGATTPTATPSPTPTATPTATDTGDKLTLTQAELDGRIQAALTAAQQKADAKAKKDREAAEAEEAKKRGEFEKVATAEKERADKAEAEARALRQSIALRDHLAEKHPDYLGCVKYIAPLIPGDAEGDALTKAVKEAAEQYAKDNPRQEKAKAGTPAPLPRTGNRPSTQPNPDARSLRATPNGNRIVSPASRF